MKKFLLILVLGLLSSALYAKDKPDPSQYEVEIAEIGKPGMLVVRTWCYNKKPTLPDATFKECAIKGVLFKGLDECGRMKGRKALVPDGYENHKDYFDQFFSSGTYHNYARVAMDGYVEQHNLIKIGKLYKIAKIVVVSYAELRQRLETDNVIKALDNGF